MPGSVATRSTSSPGRSSVAIPASGSRTGRIVSPGCASGERRDPPRVRRSAPRRDPSVPPGRGPPRPSPRRAARGRSGRRAATRSSSASRVPEGRSRAATSTSTVSGGRRGERCAARLGRRRPRAARGDQPASAPQLVAYGAEPAPRRRESREHPPTLGRIRPVARWASPQGLGPSVARTLDQRRGLSRRGGRRAGRAGRVDDELGGLRRRVDSRRTSTRVRGRRGGRRRRRASRTTRRRGCRCGRSPSP